MSLAGGLSFSHAISLHPSRAEILAARSVALWRDDVLRQDVTNFDGCGFGKHCYILLGPTSAVPFNRLIICRLGVRIPAAAPIESLSSRCPRLQTNLKDLWPEFAGHKQPAARSVVGNPIQGRMQRL
jgi:hypothetical protein